MNTSNANKKEKITDSLSLFRVIINIKIKLVKPHIIMLLAKAT